MACEVFVRTVNNPYNLIFLAGVNHLISFLIICKLFGDLDILIYRLYSLPLIVILTLENLGILSKS